MLLSVKNTNKYPWYSFVGVNARLDEFTYVWKIMGPFYFYRPEISLHSAACTDQRLQHLWQHLGKDKRMGESKVAIITLTPFPQCPCGTVGRINLHETPQLISDSQLRKIIGHEQPQSDVNGNKKKSRKLEVIAFVWLWQVPTSIRALCRGPKFRMIRFPTSGGLIVLSENEGLWKFEGGSKSCQQRRIEIDFVWNLP